MRVSSCCGVELRSRAKTSVVEVSPGDVENDREEDGKDAEGESNPVPRTASHVYNKVQHSKEGKQLVTKDSL